MIACSVPEISPGVGFCDEDGGIGYSSSWKNKPKQFEKGTYFTDLKSFAAIVISLNFT